MAKTFREWDPAQGWLLPPSTLDLVPEGHLAHFVRDTVRGEIDLAPILSDYVEERGYPPYHPALMTALLLYAYCRGVYSSRSIARACEERLDFMAVTGREAPDFRTIAAFRRRHLKALKAIFVEVVRLCREAGLPEKQRWPRRLSQRSRTQVASPNAADLGSPVINVSSPGPV